MKRLSITTTRSGTVSGRSSGRRAWALALAALVVAGSVWFHSLADAPVTGDEPHYLIYGNSLVKGWGVDLERAYRPDNRTLLYAGNLDAHAYRYRKDGPFATWHSIGLPALLAPALAVRPSPWLGRLVITILTGLLAYHLCRLCMALTRASPARAALASAAVLLSAPVLWYSGLIFPEIPLALCVVGSLRAFTEGRTPWVRFGLASTLAAGAPWFASRILPLSVVLLIAYATVAVREARDRRLASLMGTLVPLVVPTVVLAGGLAVLDWYLFGAPTPSAAVNRLPAAIGGPNASNYRLPNLYYYGVGGLVGVPAGIFPHGPALLLAAAALPLAAVRLGWRRVLVVLLATGAYVGYGAYHGSAGYGPAGRYLVAVVPLLAVPLAAGIAHSTPRLVAGVAAVAAVSVAFAVIPAGTFLRLYRPTVDDVLPVAKTASLWPFIDAHPPTRHFVAAAKAMPHVTGMVEPSGFGSAVIGREGRDPPGFLAYGPFLVFAAGKYVARFTIRGGDPGDRPSPLVLDVWASDEPSSPLAQEKVLIGPGPASAVELPFEAEHQVELQFRVQYSGTGTAGAVSVAVRAAADPPKVRHVRDEAWKALVWLGGLLVAGGVGAARARGFTPHPRRGGS